MSPEEVVGLLRDQSIITETDTGTFRMTPEAQTRYQSEQSYLTGDAGPESVQIGNIDLDINEDTLTFLAAYSLINDWLDEIPPEQMVSITLVLTWFQQSVPESDGAPENFLPIHGDQIPIITSFYSPAIVYVWRHDCDPCELVREDFEAIVESTEDISLFSVYGPQYAELLRERYDVIGGPTILFVANGKIDSRIHGAHSRQLLQSEIETVQSRA